MNEIIAALDQGRDVDALVALLELWRVQPAAALADAIDAVGARVDAKRPRPLGRGARGKQQMWHQLADKNDVADLGVLLATFAEIPRSTVIRGRLEKLAQRPRDPRIAITLARLVERWPLQGNDRTALSYALQLLVTLGDVRVVPIVDAVISDSTWWVYAAELRALQHHIGPDVRAVMAWLAAAPKPPVTDAAALLDAVYASPLDDGPRAVLADHLQLVSDPRGEFIAMQLPGPHGPRAKARRAREMELLQTYGRTWLGVIEPAIARSGVTFARGFLAKCVATVPGKSVMPQILDAREWRTVDEIDTTAWPELAQRSPALMPVLRRLRTRDAIPPHPSVEHVELEATTLAFATTNAPKLFSIALENAAFSLDAFAPFWATPLAKQLTYFYIDVQVIDGWIAALWPRVKPRGPLERAIVTSVRQVPWRFWLEADGALRIENIWTALRPYSSPQVHLDPLAQMLEQLDATMFTQIRFEVSLVKMPRRLAAAMARFKR